MPNDDAHVEAAARVLYEAGHGYNIDEDPVARESMMTLAAEVLAASSYPAEVERLREALRAQRDEARAEAERLRSAVTRHQMDSKLDHRRADAELYAVLHDEESFRS